MMIIISTRYKQHDKVPKSEQLIAAGCAAHAMQMAAYSLGLGAIWRTGELTHSDKVKHALSIKADDDIVGFLYIGNVEKPVKIKPSRSYENYVSYLA
jgi:nitroreductase